jgi:peptidoglycan hydrolase FlgJ
MNDLSIPTTSPIDFALQSANNGAEKSATAAVKSAKGQDVDTAAQSFESMFLGQMLAPMFEGIETDDTFGGGHGETMFRSMLVTEYGRLMSESGGIGIADSVKQVMLHIQEGTQK